MHAAGDVRGGVTSGVLDSAGAGLAALLTVPCHCIVSAFGQANVACMQSYHSEVGGGQLLADNASVNGHELVVKEEARDPPMDLQSDKVGVAGSGHMQG